MIICSNSSDKGLKRKEPGEKGAVKMEEEDSKHLKTEKGKKTKLDMDPELNDPYYTMKREEGMSEDGLRGVEFINSKEENEIINVKEENEADHGINGILYRYSGVKLGIEISTPPGVDISQVSQELKPQKKR